MPVGEASDPPDAAVAPRATALGMPVALHRSTEAVPGAGADVGVLFLRPNPVIRFGIEPPITRSLLRRPLAQIIVEGGRTGVGA